MNKTNTAKTASAEQQAKKRRRKFTVYIFLGMMFLVSAGWWLTNMGHMSFEQVLFHLQVPAQGANLSPVLSYLMVTVPLAILGTIIVYFIVFGTERYAATFREGTLGFWKTALFKVGRWLRRHALKFAAIILIIGFLTLFFSFRLPEFIYYQVNQSSRWETEFSRVHADEMRFPEKKRNLIYIFLESMESSYTDKAHGGAYNENIIPNLTKLALEEGHDHFSNREGQLGGAQQPMTGLSWTIAGMVGQSAGIPLKVPLEANAYGHNEPFLPGAVALGDILQEQGYHLELMFGSDAGFGARDNYYREHGDYVINDYNAAKADGRIPEDYMEFWGYEDEKLFEFAKDRLTELADADEPFAFTCLTVDSHFPDGYHYADEPEPFNIPYGNALFNSDRRVYEFVQWIRQQDFYENTTVVISGDHLTMAEPFVSDIPSSYTRTVYNCILNSVVEPGKRGMTGRHFTTMDMFPTTLAAMGVTWQGNRLNYGTNLYSDQATLLEQLGMDGVNDMLNRHSDFYRHEFLLKED